MSNVVNIADQFLQEMNNLESKINKMIYSGGLSVDQYKEVRRRQRQLQEAKRAWMQAA